VAAEMLKITVEHKNCKMTRVIEGETIFDAFKKNGLNFNTWVVIDIEKA
jgi:hypothetical protein